MARNNRYYDPTRQSHSGYARSQSGNPADDEMMEEISEDWKKIHGDNSKYSKLLRKVLRNERSNDLRIQRLQEFQAYLQESDSNKVNLIDVSFESFPGNLLVFDEISPTNIEYSFRTISRTVGIIFQSNSFSEHCQLDTMKQFERN